MSPIRVLYVIDSLAPGGAETSLAAMVPTLTDYGVDLHVLPLANRLHLAPSFEVGGAVVHQAPTSRGRLQAVKHVIETGRLVNPGLVHTTLFEADIAGRVGGARLGLPVTGSLVNDSYGPSHYAESNRAKLAGAHALDVLTSRRVSAFQALTLAMAKTAEQRLRIPRTKIEVIPRGRDPQKFEFRHKEWREETRRQLGISPTAPVVLAVGRLEPQKGLQHLILASAEVHAAHPDLEVLIAGKPGRASKSLADLASQLRNPIRFLGHRADTPQLLAAADALVFPSEREGFGGVLIEAMAAGCPIVASRIPTSIEVLGDGAYGRLTPAGDSPAIAVELQKILSSPPQLDEQLRAARNHFEKNYSIDAVGAQFASFLHAHAQVRK